MAPSPQSQPPRGALAVLAVGLIATVAAALLSTSEPLGAVTLEWKAKAPLPDSPVARLPDGSPVQLTRAGLRVTAPNIAGYKLYRVAAVLTIGANAAVGHARVRCVEKVPPDTIVAHTPKKRASYPRPSDELLAQPVPPDAIVEFNAHGSDVVAVELEDAFRAFTDRSGVKVEWLPYRRARQGWEWNLPGGRFAKPLTLAVVSVWRTTKSPQARLDCAVMTAGGSAEVSTGGRLAA